MKKLFLFVLTAMMICGCSKNENENPAPPEEDIFSVDITSLEFRGRGGPRYSSFESTQEWTLSGGASWCEPSQKIGSGTEPISLSIFLQQAIQQLITAQLHSRSKAENNR